MKKLLLGIFGILLGFVGFSSANPSDFSGGMFAFRMSNLVVSSHDLTKVPDGYCVYLPNSSNGQRYQYVISGLDITYSFFDIISSLGNISNYVFICSKDSDNYGGLYLFNTTNTTYSLQLLPYDDYLSGYVSGGGSSTPIPTPSDITVFYDYGHSSTTIACNGDNSIFIDGMASVSNQTTFTPFFNINYVDQDNQIITESYSKDILYLSNGWFHKTYTGDNEWVLSVDSCGGSFFTGYLPTFEITGNITELDTGNVFNNFAENSLSVLLSNIPNYIQYVIIFLLLLFILGIFRKLR